jgi:lipoprotein-releasing system permease protein
MMLDKVRENERAKLKRLGHYSATTSVVSDIEEEEIEELGRNEVIIGIDLARSLGIFAGEEIVAIPPEALLYPPGEPVPYEKLKVKKIVQTDLPDFDEHFIFYTIGKSFLHFEDPASLESGVEIYIPNPEKTSPLERKLSQVEGAKVESWRARNSALFYSLTLEKRLMTLFLILTLLIGSFSIVTVLVLLGTQKRRDMGILMAAGMTVKRARGVFVKIGILLSSFGVGSGLLLGLFICLILANTSLIQLPDIYYDQSLPVRVDPLLMALVVLVSAAVAYICSWLPAFMTSQLTPVEALRKHVQKRK